MTLSPLLYHDSKLQVPIVIPSLYYLHLTVECLNVSASRIMPFRYDRKLERCIAVVPFVKVFVQMRQSIVGSLVSLEECS